MHVMSTFATGGDIKIKTLFTSLFISDGGAYSLPVLPCHCPFHLTARYFTRNDGYRHAGGSIPGLMAEIYQSQISRGTEHQLVHDTPISKLPLCCCKE
jgi:hypothetical protein